MSEYVLHIACILHLFTGKTRRERRDFPGAEKILAQVKDKSLVKRKRIGFISRSGPPPRSHMAILDSSGSTPIGEITSGCPSPSLGYNVAMGYVQTSSNHATGQAVKIQVRNQQVDAEIAKMPFIKSKYYMPPKK